MINLILFLQRYIFWVIMEFDPTNAAMKIAIGLSIHGISWKDILKHILREEILQWVYFFPQFDLAASPPYYFIILIFKVLTIKSYASMENISWCGRGIMTPEVIHFDKSYKWTVLFVRIFWENIWKLPLIYNKWKLMWWHLKLMELKELA